MPRLPRPTAKEMIHFLEQEGFSVARVRGSHHFLERGEKHTSVPVHGNQQLRIGTFRSILRDIELSPAEFEKLWRE